MDGREFLDLSKQLLTKPEEAAVRSAISRAYCAGYGYARHVLRELGFSRAAKDPQHGTASRYLRNCGYEPLVEAARMLDSLQAARQGADYDLHKPKFGKPKNGQIHVDEAAEVIARLETCQTCQGIQKSVQQGLREYERKTSSTQAR